jgi:hypothetical protein
MKVIVIITFIFSLNAFSKSLDKKMPISMDDDFYKIVKVKIPKFNFTKLHNSIDRVIYSDTVSIKQSSTKKSDMFFISFDDDELGQAQETHDSLIEIAAESINLKKRTVAKLGGFELVFMDSEEENFSDSGSTSILFNDSSLFKDIRTFKIKEKSHITLNSQIEFDGAEIFTSYPMFEIESFHSKFQEFADHGYLLVELSENIEMTNINAEFSKKYYLDNKFNTVNPEKSDYIFELYTGVQLGNVNVDFFHKSKMKYSKISHIYERELTFEQSFINVKKDRSFKLNITNIYGVDERLDLTKEQIYNSVIDSDLSVSGNVVKLKHQNYLMTQRNLFEIKFDDDSIYVGSMKNNEFSIPSKEFSDKILEIFNISTLSNQCIVQVNLDSSYVSAYLSGYAGNQYLNQDVYYLDVDGQFYREMTRDSKKLFIRTYLDDFDGLIFLELTKKDGSHRNLTTICSTGSYLVEHL